MRPLFATVAVVLALLVPFTEIAMAQPTATVECCCGRHDAGTPCDCPDCPAAHHADGSQAGTPTAGPCHGPRTLWHSVIRTWIVSAPAEVDAGWEISDASPPTIAGPWRSRDLPTPTPPPRVSSSTYL